MQPERSSPGSASQHRMARIIQARSEERRQGRTEPGKLNTALVIQGGTLRSVASCGAAAALNYLGLTNAFDKVYASSSGAINGAYFLTQQAALGVTVYLEDVNSLRFLNFLRFGNRLDLDFLLGDIAQREKRHNLVDLVNHPTELKILTANLNTSQSVWFSSQDRAIDVYQALKASMALPVLYGRGVPIGRHSYVDGYIVEPVPVLTPLKGAYTDILVLLNRHVSARERSKPRLLSRLVFHPLMRREVGDQLYAHYRQLPARYNFALDTIESGRYTRPNGDQIRLAYICPESDAEVHSFELGADRLRAAAYSSWQATFRFFGVTCGSDEETFRSELSRAKELNTSLRSPEGGSD